MEAANTNKGCMVISLHSRLHQTKEGPRAFGRKREKSREREREMGTWGNLNVVGYMVVTQQNHCSREILETMMKIYPTSSLFFSSFSSNLNPNPNLNPVVLAPNMLQHLATDRAYTQLKPFE